MGNGNERVLAIDSLRHRINDAEHTERFHQPFTHISTDSHILSISRMYTVICRLSFWLYALQKDKQKKLTAHRDFLIIAPYKYSYLLTYLLITTNKIRVTIKFY